MLMYPTLDPIAFQIGSLAIHWYGLMYLFGFCAAWSLGTLRAQRMGWQTQQVADLVFFVAVGIILGGRIGYVLFYDWNHFIQSPWVLFAVWQGGMSFHGGLVGTVLALWVYSRKSGKPFFAVTDFTAPLVPIGLGAGRLGNFINGELWGRPTDMSWGMVFPHVDSIPRHPSMLYELFLEGIVLFIVLWVYSMKPRPLKAVSGLFLLLYGMFRFSIEFLREPDIQLGFIAFDWLTMGQLLSVPMIIIGAVLLWLAYKSCNNT